MKKFFIFILSVPISVLVLMNVLLYLQQTSMLFYPYKELEATPTDWQLPYEDISITGSDNVKLHGWYLPVKGAKHALLFFHGNAGNISHRGDSLEIFHHLGLNTLIIDYRGYGSSQGKISEQGMYIDAKSAWQFLIENKAFKPDDIIIFGRSLGGAVAAELASHVQPRALILESTFSSVRDMANIMMPFISRVLYLRYVFDTELKIKQVQAPLLLMHSPDDEIIPYALGEKVFAAANSPKYSYQLRGGHNDGFLQSQPGYAQAIETFLAYLP